MTSNNGYSRGGGGGGAGGANRNSGGRSSKNIFFISPFILFPLEILDGCFNCGKEGHRSYECTEPKKAGGGGGGGCFNCGKDGHKSFECSEPKKAGGGRSGGGGSSKLFLH